MSVNTTHIQWAEKVWNPTTGCSPVSKGCTNCYAYSLSKKMQAQGVPKYANGFNPTFHPHALKKPYSWTSPSRVFVNSMSDLFHNDFTISEIQKVFDVMNNCPQHEFLVLTKRPGRAAQLASHLIWTDNIKLGTSVAQVRDYPMIDDLRKTPALIKFVSAEPLLEDLPGIDLDGIDAVIIGGESGPGSRPCETQWVRHLFGECYVQDTKVFMKQWGSVKASQNRLRDPKGGDMNEWPPMYRVRQTF